MAFSFQNMCYSSRVRPKSALQCLALGFLLTEGIIFIVFHLLNHIIYFAILTSPCANNLKDTKFGLNILICIFKLVYKNNLRLISQFINFIQYELKSYHIFKYNPFLTHFLYLISVVLCLLNNWD